MVNSWDLVYPAPASGRLTRAPQPEPDDPPQPGTARLYVDLGARGVLPSDLRSVVTLATSNGPVRTLVYRVSSEDSDPWLDVVVPIDALALIPSDAALRVQTPKPLAGSVVDASGASSIAAEPFGTLWTVSAPEADLWGSAWGTIPDIGCLVAGP